MWKNEHPKFRISYSVPVYRPESKGAEITLQGARGVAAYDLADGKERWWVGGLTASSVPTPVEGDGLLFVVSHSPGGDPEDRMKLHSGVRHRMVRSRPGEALAAQGGGLAVSNWAAAIWGGRRPRSSCRTGTTNAYSWRSLSSAAASRR